MNINDIGLTALSWIKKLRGESVDIDALKLENQASMTHEIWGDLLKQHVTEAGQVNYEGFLKDSTALQNYLAALSTHPPGNNWSEQEQLVYWINAYNAFTVKLILDHYPVKSIKDISKGLPMVSSPWDLKFFKIGEVDFDLNTIEHEILRKQFLEPRIHFAINCASVSCPKLRNEAFNVEDLERQLEEQAKGFINNPSKNLIAAKELKLSRIFDWFKSDFEKQKPVLDYIGQYNSSMNKSNPVEYLEYNWSLNN